MKKTVVILLIVLPFVMIVLISFAARIMATYTKIPVEQVTLIDIDGKQYSNSKYVDVQWQEELKIFYAVGPRLAANKGVTFFTSNSDKCEILDIVSYTKNPELREMNNVDGHVIIYPHRMEGPNTTISVYTDESKLSASVTLRVVNNDVKRVVIEELHANNESSEISWTDIDEIPEIHLDVSQRLRFSANVETTSGDMPTDSEYRNIEWVIDNPAVVSKSTNGTVCTVEGLLPGEETYLRVKTTVARDNAGDPIFAVIKLIVNDTVSPFFFKNQGIACIEQGELEVDLTDPKILANQTGYEVTFRIPSTFDYTGKIRLDGNILVLLDINSKEFFIIEAYIDGHPEYGTAELLIYWERNGGS